MSLWRQLTHGLRILFRRSDADRDLADEVEHYLEQAAAAHEAAGEAPEAARRIAFLEVGHFVNVRDQVRGHGWEHLADTLGADVRQGLRRLRRRPGFAAVSVATLALGISASTVIFSALKPVLLDPLPYPHGDRLVMIWDTALDGSRIDVTFGTFVELAARTRSFAALAVMRPWQPTLTGGAEPAPLDGQRVSAQYFRALGVAPVLGRGFDAADDEPGSPRVLVISDGLWHRRFAGDQTVIGRHVLLDGTDFTVVGVMPRGFENLLAPSSDAWTTLQYDRSLPLDGREWGHHLRLVGRLQPWASIAEVRRGLDAVARTPLDAFPRAPWASLESGITVDNLQDELARGVRAGLLAIAGAVLVLLALACVNVTSLLVGHLSERQPEFAMRAALGAPRLRLVRQQVTETLLLAALGGAGGLLLAQAAMGALTALAPPELPRAGAIALDRSVFAFALVLTTIVGLLVSIVPARHISDAGLSPGIRQASPRAAVSHHLTRRTLVVVQVALALVLLAGAGLLLRSLQHLFAVPPGFDATGLLTMKVQVSGRGFDDDAATNHFFEQALEAVRRVPGVGAVAFTSQLPLTGEEDAYGVHLEAGRPLRPDEDSAAFRYAVSPEYFDTMGIPLLRGRRLEAHDRADTPRAVVIAESLARRRYGGRDPLGQRLKIGPDTAPWYTVVGVVGDVKQASLAAAARDAVYLPATQWQYADRSRWIVVRTPGDPAALAPAVRRAIWSVNRDQPILGVATMEERLAASGAQRRFTLTLFEAFALAALALAAVGIFGVLSASVTERRREIGVRSALGASRGSILALVFRQGMGLAGIGIGIGLAGALAASRVLATLLFDVSRLDPLTYLGVTAILGTVAALACGVPAWRAVHVPPSIALVSE